MTKDLTNAEVLAITNKAIVYDMGDLVAKRYRTQDAADRVRQDQQSLGQMWLAFGQSRVSGWLYTVAKPIRADYTTNTIWLEKAPGQTIFMLPEHQAVIAEYHVGVWLATYHNRVFGDSVEGQIFADTNVSNILIDPVGMTIVGLDPGSGWGRKGYRYEDIIRHIYSLIVQLRYHRRKTLPAVRAFLQGYISTASGTLDEKAYVISLGREITRQWARYGEKSKRKQLAFIAGGVLLAPLFTIYVPSILNQQ